MLARKWSLLSCSEACSPSSMCSQLVVARIEATTGLHMSQPFPLPKRSMSPEKGRTDSAGPAVTISYNSALLWLKCSQSALDCWTPWASSNCLSSGTHDPQEVPACVHCLRAGTSQHPPEMGSAHSPLGTLLHEQT